jgi:hypothetical protein
MTSISLLAASAVVVALSASGPVAGEQMVSVRGRDAAADHLLQFGAERSPTFRALLEDLRLSDVIVYVQVQHDPESAPGGSLQFIGSGGPFRWVMATVDTGSSRPGSLQANLVALTAILGHELQHAREVSAVRSIRTVADFDTHFRTVGIGVGRNAVDTDAARDVGRIVEGEIRGLLKKAL